VELVVVEVPLQILLLLVEVELVVIDIPQLIYLEEEHLP
tara:strand:- start:467 stop:583 length:117 start_codon:yes stop_codon:yes gene_type:complete